MKKIIIHKKYSKRLKIHKILMEVLQQRNTELEKELTDANQQIAQLKSEKEEIAKRISTNFFI